MTGIISGVSLARRLGQADAQLGPALERATRDVALADRLSKAAGRMAELALVIVQITKEVGCGC